MVCPPAVQSLTQTPGLAVADVQNEPVAQGVALLHGSEQNPPRHLAPWPATPQEVPETSVQAAPMVFEGGVQRSLPSGPGPEQTRSPGQVLLGAEQSCKQSPGPVAALQAEPDGHPFVLPSAQATRQRPPVHLVLVPAGPHWAPSVAQLCPTPAPEGLQAL